MVMVINSQKALDSLHTNKLKLGGDASVALGSKGAGTGATATADFIVYSKVKGAYAGVAVDGSVLDVRQSLNTAYYGQPATPIDILVKRSVNNPEAAPLLMAVEQAAK
jgi:lipid-binding SYLF domain-containing protein